MVFAVLHHLQGVGRKFIHGQGEGCACWVGNATGGLRKSDFIAQNDSNMRFTICEASADSNLFKQ